MDNELVTSCVVSTKIDKVLLKISKKEYEIFQKKLYNEQKLYMLDCYKNPDKVKKTLLSVYGEFTTNRIIRELELEFDDLMHQKEFSEFIKKLND